MMTENLIHAEGVTKSYWIDAVETKVLKGIDLKVEPKGLMAIVGASGAGKSTLLHLLSSLDSPTSGRILFDGREFPKKDAEISRFRNEKMGFVFQFHHLMPEFSALENVMMPLLIRGDRKKEAAEKGKNLLSRLGLESRADHRPTELSGGEQQRVAVARALIASPKILFADEPTGNLDHENGEKLIDLLFELHREKEMALVLVTHNASVAARFSKRIQMEDGKIIRVEG
jgi:lipoprotein-releasing system ATP-binding protein